MKFDLTVANWLAYVADARVNTSKLGHTEHEKLMLGLLLNKLNRGCGTFNESEDESSKIKELLDRFDSLVDKETLEDIYVGVREYLAKKHWLAIIIPSGIEAELDDILCDPEMLGYLVQSTSQNQGLILQVEEAPSEITTLFDVHEAMNTALNDSIKWPGILIWNTGGDSVFLPVGSVNFFEIDIEARVQWVFSKLFSQVKLDLGRLRVEYENAFPEVFECETKMLQVLQLSDLYIGSNKSSLRISRVQEYIRALVEELGETSKILPVITGNFMDNPSEKQIDMVASFWKFLSGMGTEQPLLVFGNNDVRKDGNINESYRNAVGFQDTKVTWYEDEKLAFISLNTVVHGNSAYGAIGEEQLDAIEYEIERKKDRAEYKLVILMHHLPIQHQAQNNVMQPFYEKIIGEPFDRTKVIEGADLLWEFVKKHSIAVFLHGHQHIPFISQTEDNIPVVGCGSTIGLKSKFDGSVYFSINIISINHITNKISTRLLAIRKPGVGFSESKRHVVIYRALI